MQQSGRPAYRAGKPIVTLLGLCRNLRRGTTEAELRLWRHLRARQLGVKFRRQHQFGPFILDFYCAEASLAVEADGSQHFSEAGLANDRRRTEYLQERGVRVLRFTDREILCETEAVLCTIQQTLAGPSP
jgi:adenine-specific DNA-methyltransferase